MLTFAAAVLFLLITPGPGVLSAAGVGAAYGWKIGTRYVAGLWAGNLIVSLIVASGLWAVIAAIPGLRLTLGALSLAYFFYLAAKIALSGTTIRFGSTATAPGWVNGVTLQFINPKAYAVNTMLFANFALLQNQWAAEIAIKILIFNIFWIPVHAVWLYAGCMVERLDLAPGTQRAINIAMAASMLIVIALAAYGST